MNNKTLYKIKKLLEKKFKPDVLKIKDLSHLHKDHKGSEDGKGHYSIYIVSDLFHNTSLINKHKMIYDSLDDIMLNEIHSLKIKALEPEK
ncbi:MAG: hypothetical protein CBC38_06090 [Gammaproteobacteria bacterium TMED78]|nr:MAG: hypothetical protein CBC38_06090 [Gammaproteobacteria bacterium TMED78]|tara:strand:- start:501 stop:770 length:270 start_codon:yes stop_codon:yes gene_type:complete